MRAAPPAGKRLRRRCAALLCVALGNAVTVGTWAAARVTDGSQVATSVAEDRAIAAILHDSVVSPADPTTHPLPLAASWNDGSVATGFSPAWQVEEIRSGQYLLPWFILPVQEVALERPIGPKPADPRGPGAGHPAPAGYARPGDALYYEPAIQYLAQHHLPLSFESPQWEAILPLVSPAYAKFDSAGHTLPLSPFDPPRPWYEVGLEWAHHPVIAQLQRLYPDPPLVVFLSNNEQAKLTPEQLHAQLDAHPSQELSARRRAIGDAWIERYRQLLQGFRDGLAPKWRSHALFVGYDAFVTPAIGRWGGWAAYSLYVPGRTEPWPYAWDGASVSFYVHNWAGDADYTLWSPQIESMNWVAEIAQVRRARPSFWFEMSTWDGQLPGQPTDKRRFYQQRGQELTPARYAGMVQFGMWLLRPRSVREFRNPEDDRIRFGAYFDEILAAVARVHDQPVLSDFWQHGRLLSNPANVHPYEAALPPELAARERWFLLDSAANPPQPWELTTPLKVFSLALERGERPNRQWLVYAYAPLENEIDVEVQIPGGRRATVRASRAGTFSLITENNSRVQTIG